MITCYICGHPILEGQLAHYKKGFGHPGETDDSIPQAHLNIQDHLPTLMTSEDDRLEFRIEKAKVFLRSEGFHIS